NFAERGVGFLWRLRIDTRADSPLLWAGLQGRTGRLITRPFAAIANQLVKRGHSAAPRRCFPRAHTNCRTDSQSVPVFLNLSQDLGLDSFATHASGHSSDRGFSFPFDRSDDGGSTPRNREALRFASIVPHNLPCRERFAERFSEGV